MTAEGFLPPETWGENPIRVTSRAQGFGENLCVIGLDSAASSTLHLEGDAELSADRRSVYSNSRRTW